MVTLISTKAKRERALLVSLTQRSMTQGLADESLQELKALCSTAHLKVTDTLTFPLRSVRAAYYIGTGQLEAIREYINHHEIEVVVFNNDLKPVQVRNLDKALNKRIMGRTELILEIFRMHARSSEAKTQVELAQLEYMLPRLTRFWTHLSRQYGARGATRGAGESQLESDRRALRNRITALKKKLKKITAHRHIIAARKKFPLIALVGYTNAGKSTVLNRLAKAHLKTANQLFVTLDPTTRKVWLGFRKEVLMSDTVGFIRDLPHGLVASFRATLSEVTRADLLLHVVDINTVHIEDTIAVVESVLCELNAIDKPVLMVFNKIDVLTQPDRLIRFQALNPGSCAVSAVTGEGFDELKDHIIQRLFINEEAVCPNR